MLWRTAVRTVRHRRKTQNRQDRSAGRRTNFAVAATERGEPRGFGNFGMALNVARFLYHIENALPHQIGVIIRAGAGAIVLS